MQRSGFEEKNKRRGKRSCAASEQPRKKKKKTTAWWILWMARTEYPTLVTRSNSPKSAFFDFRLQPPLPFLARENRTKMGEKTQLSRAFGFEVCSKLASSVPQRCRNSYMTLRKRRFTTVCFDLLLFTHFCLFTSAKPLKLWSWQNNNNNKKKKRSPVWRCSNAQRQYTTTCTAKRPSLHRLID